MYLATGKVCNKQHTGQTADMLNLGGITTDLRVDSLIRMKNACKNIFTVFLKVRVITVF